MPLDSNEVLGTNSDQSKNEEYCCYCFKNGAFTKEVTMEEMIATCVQMLDEYNKDAKQRLTKEEAIAEMRKHFPELKRWKQA